MEGNEKKSTKVLNSLLDSILKNNMSFKSIIDKAKEDGENKVSLNHSLIKGFMNSQGYKWDKMSKRWTKDTLNDSEIKAPVKHKKLCNSSENEKLLTDLYTKIDEIEKKICELNNKYQHIAERLEYSPTWRFYNQSNLECIKIIQSEGTRYEITLKTLLIEKITEIIKNKFNDSPDIKQEKLAKIIEAALLDYYFSNQDINNTATKK